GGHGEHKGSERAHVHGIAPHHSGLHTPGRATAVKQATLLIHAHQFSVAVIVTGALLAALRDFSFEAYGYSLVFLSNITTALYLAFIARLGKATGLNSFGLMWCNGVICIPALLLWTFLSGEIQRALDFPALLQPNFLAVLSMSCLMAFALNYTIFLNTTLNSALTQTMCGNIKDLGTVGIGWALFGGLPFDL
ncbi:unnamed protein product, partial [Closterium sp. NIES-54]